MVRVPALAERPGDIPLLAQHFLERAARKFGVAITRCDDAVLEALQAHPWPGQVRELRNIIERACILCDKPVLDLPSLPIELQGQATSARSPVYELEQVEREHVRRVLHHTGGNKTLAAALLGIGLTTLYAKLKKWGG